MLLFAASPLVWVNVLYTNLWGKFLGYEKR